MDGDGRAESIVSSSGYKGRLLLTFCKPFNIGGQTAYPHSVVAFPESYEAAKLDALRVFAAHLPRTVNRANIVLKCAIRRTNGMTVWCSISPGQWKATIRSDGDEIGVFLPDNLNASYEAEVKPTSNTQTSTAAQALARKQLPSLTSMAHYPVTPAQQQKIVNLTYQERFWDEDGYNTSKSKMVGAPETLMELKELAKTLFGLNPAYQITIKSKPTGFGMDEVEIHETSYARFIATGKEPIQLTAS